MKFKYVNIIFLLSLFLLANCNLYRPTDARKISPNPEERVKQNIEEGKGLRLSGLMKGGNTNFQFASSNALWRASLEMLDFTPLINADYSGGIIITDWFSLDDDKNNAVYKITVRFLSNEIRADGLEVSTHQKICGINNVCRTKKFDNELNYEISTKILSRAAEISKNELKKNAKENPYSSQILKKKRKK
tara:strand:+ start:500 stop:1069 length:570 start_codon:yes stop_codon:yes gene_type:complete